MWTFIVAGALYLIGVSIVLVLKPEFMFTPDGNWKEFGIGKNKGRYTPFPFWLFCLVWAVVAYTIVLLLLPFVVDVNDTEMANSANRANSGNIRPMKNNARNNRARNNKTNNAELEMDSGLEFDDETFGEFGEFGEKNPKKGYYVLNRKASRIAGVPKYVYIGEEEP